MEQLPRSNTKKSLNKILLFLIASPIIGLLCMIEFAIALALTRLSEIGHIVTELYPIFFIYFIPATVIGFLLMMIISWLARTENNRKIIIISFIMESIMAISFGLQWSTYL